VFEAKIIDNVLSAEESELISLFLSNLGHWSQSNGGGLSWEGRIIHDYNVFEKNNQMGLLLASFRNRFQKVISDAYQLKDLIYPDTFELVRWDVGSEQSPHWDDMVGTDAPEEHLNWCKHRAYGSVLYLNDDYTGGETYYSNYDFQITPKAGRLAVHPGDKNHAHGVRKILGKTRYTIASFWTFDKSFEDIWIPNVNPK
jgi:hypothetical protein